VGSSLASEPNGLINLQGKGIQRLVLTQQFGENESQTFNEPNESIKVAPGKYRVSQLELRGGYSMIRGDPGRRNCQITVEEGKSATLKVGGPLSQNVKVTRQGCRLKLDYKLDGIGGEHYSDSLREKAPTFAVYRGDVQMGNGTFAYG
jgi:hypothetical protein